MFLEKERLRKHAESHIKQNTGPGGPAPDSQLFTFIPSTKRFKCTSCDKDFAHQKGVRQHFETAHMGIRYKCPECKKTFRQEVSLRNHKLICSGAPPGQDSSKGLIHKCQYCTMRFRQNYRKLLHERTVHLKIRDFECNICKKAFTQSASLRTHQKLIHFPNPLKCGLDGCKMTYTTKYMLERHRKKCHVKSENPKKETLIIVYDK